MLDNFLIAFLITFAINIIHDRNGGWKDAIVMLIIFVVFSYPELRQWVVDLE